MRTCRQTGLGHPDPALRRRTETTSMGSPSSGTDAHSPRDSTSLELHHTENYHLTVETSQESPPLGSQQPGRAWPAGRNPLPTTLAHRTTNHRTQTSRMRRPPRGHLEGHQQMAAAPPSQHTVNRSAPRVPQDTCPGLHGIIWNAWLSRPG
jgi:hypothetical protein